MFLCRRFKEKKEAVEPEADPERDQRTVFAYQVRENIFYFSLHLHSDNIYTFVFCLINLLLIFCFFVMLDALESD